MEIHLDCVQASTTDPQPHHDHGLDHVGRFDWCKLSQLPGLNVSEVVTSLLERCCCSVPAYRQRPAASLPHLMARHMTVICWSRSRTASMDVRAPRRCTRREMPMLPPTAAMEPASSLRAVFACRCASCMRADQTPSGRGVLCGAEGAQTKRSIHCALCTLDSPQQCPCPPCAMLYELQLHLATWRDPATAARAR